jgi:hypothetical protein
MDFMSVNDTTDSAASSLIQQKEHCIFGVGYEKTEKAKNDSFLPSWWSPFLLLLYPSDTLTQSTAEGIDGIEV